MIIREEHRKNATLFCCVLFIISWLSSDFLLSVSMIGFLLISLTGNIKEQWKNFRSNKALLGLTLIFFLIFISGFWSRLLYLGEFGYYLERLRIKLPFLIMPFAFAGLPKLTAKSQLNLLYFLLLTMTICSIGIGINYALNFEEITKAVKEGRNVPTPINHIRYSLLLAYTIIVGFYLYRVKHVYKWPKESALILGFSFFLFGFIHLLSVRSGLLALYFALLVLLLQFIVQSKRFILGAALLVSIILLPIIAYKTVPSFYEKINYTRYNLEQFRQGKISGLSDGQRLISYEIGWEIVKQNPIIGTGVGDLRADRDLLYAILYPGLKGKNPHNQFLFTACHSGILGLLLFIFFMFFPLFYKGAWKHPLLLGFYSILLISFMVENTIETAIGTAFALFFLLLEMKRVSEV